ncbi:hypothetical protein CEB94_17120 [Streptomyces hawaiiensis]|uniref:Uncharacterized protein n=1 Tax=Streptomyces hawaiiensis TaxID=67305 RepID=A0A6G5RES5_9ACTN|nr:hypothetical protein CEB94_17120 [Streptomyces hawaiiensis]
MHHPARLTTAALTASSAALLLTACGSGGTEIPSASPSAAASASASASAGANDLLLRPQGDGVRHGLGGFDVLRRREQGRPCGM